MNIPTTITACLMAAILLGTPAWAVITSDTPGSHIVTPGEPAFGVNLDGVAVLGFQSPNMSSIDDIFVQCSGALITDHHLLTAAHCFDEDADREIDPWFVQFPFGDLEFPIVAGFELADRSVLLSVRTDTIRFAPDWPNAEADLAVLELVEIAPADLPRYSLYDGSDELGSAVVLTGYGDTGSGAGGIDHTLDNGTVKRAGLNRYEAIRETPGEALLAYDFDSGQIENNALALLDFESDLGFGTDEVMTAPGDSGAPSFVDGAIAGVAVYGSRHPEADVNDWSDHSWGEIGFDVRVSSHRDFLLEATDGQVVFVPEPSAWSLWMTGAILVGWRQVAARRSPGKQWNTTNNKHLT